MGGAYQYLNDTFQRGVAQGSVLTILFAFLLGVFIGFTPCIYPVLPLTVAYIGRVARGGKMSGLFYSVIYVLGMAIVYATVGAITAIVGGQLGSIWSNGWFILILANFFIALALWQLNVIRIPTPAFLQGSTGKRGGILGTLGVGAAAGLIAGPCIVPGVATLMTVIGSGVKEANAGAVIFGAVVMFAYSLGMGSLVIICGTFSGFLANLPRSGRWLSVVEKVFAVLMILLAEYFLIYLGQSANFPLIGGFFLRQ